MKDIYVRPKASAPA